MNLSHKSIEFREGADAYAEGTAQDANPYRWTHERCKGWSADELESETERFIEWQRGREHAQDADDNDE